MGEGGRSVCFCVCEMVFSRALRWCYGRHDVGVSVV
jgi:hypothetical protein